MRGIVGLTGSPGTGKKSVAQVAGELLKLRVVSLNDLAAASGLLKPGSEGEVDIQKMRRRVEEVKGPALVYGHLLPYVVKPSAVEKVAVLRCEPSVLKLRLTARGYPSQKVAENVEAELIGVVSADAYQAFGPAKTFEVDATKSKPPGAAKKVVEAVRGKGPSSRIDWTVDYDSGAKLRSLLGGG